MTVEYNVPPEDMIVLRDILIKIRNDAKWEVGNGDLSRYTKHEKMFIIFQNGESLVLEGRPIVGLAGKFIL